MQTFTVACCQVRARDLADAEAGLQDILHALDEAGYAGARLVALPECAYPAYYLGDADPYSKPGVRPYAQVLELLGEKARRYGYWIAAGLAVPTENGRLTNSGVAIDPQGEVRGKYDKHFLWHFDNAWFDRGMQFPVFDTGFCRFGILICADGRQPEIARALAVNGAEVIVDLTAWVSWGRTTADLNTTQCEYLMPVRAFENGAWVVAADKWGDEAGSIIYAGRSGVFDPAGRSVVCGPTDRAAVVTYELTSTVTGLVPRRPALYGRLVDPWESLPVAAMLKEPLVPAEENCRVAVSPGPATWDVDALTALYTTLRSQDTDLVVFPGMQAKDGWREGLATLEALVSDRGGALQVAVHTDGSSPARRAVLITPVGTTEHHATHGRGLELGEVNAPVIATPVGNVGILCGDEGLVPEVARCLALEGADLLAWSAFEPHPMLEQVARARSDENHVYTAVAWPGGGRLVTPAGAPATGVPDGTGVAMAWQVNRAMARWKDMAPGTNVIRDRAPEAYRALVE